jgi:diacylglycerol kinase
MKRHHISFKHAWDGVVVAVRTQPNFRVHLLVSVTITVLGFLLHISSLEWAVLFITVALGLAIELLNTSIEFTVDLITKEYHELAKFAKDTAAAAMLIYAVGAIAVGLVVFVPHLLRLWLYI